MNELSQLVDAGITPSLDLDGEIPVAYVLFELDGPEYANVLSIAADRLGLTVRMVEGCYKGVENTTYFVDGWTFLTLQQYGVHALWNKQESVLSLGLPIDGNQDRRRAHLNFSNQKFEDIGIFQIVPEEVARASDGWTRMKGDAGQPIYFTCIKEPVA